MAANIVASVIFCGLLPSLLSAAPPTVESLFPAGGTRGEETTVSVSGTINPWPPQVWISRPDVQVVVGEMRTQPPTEEAVEGRRGRRRRRGGAGVVGELKVTVPADAAPGVCFIRLYNAEGASALKPWIIGTLPEADETEPNNAPDAAESIELPSIVNGRFDRGDTDVYAITLTQGQTLVASLEGNWNLASPLDGVLQILNADGFVLEQNDDARGLDPLLTFTAPADGRYLVRTFCFPAATDSTIGLSGGPGFLYRLTLTAGAYVDQARPLSVTRGAAQALEPTGWNIGEELRSLSLTADETQTEMLLFHPLAANPLKLPVVNHPSLIDTEPNPLETPQAIEFPATITGRIDLPDDADAYQFTAKAGDIISIRVEARTLGYPLDPVLTLLDATGKTISRVDDAGAGRDAEMTFTAPAEGAYKIVVSDLHHRGGFRFAYRLTLERPVANFNLALAADAFVITPGQPLEIPVTVNRLTGFDEEIEISVADLPEGITAEVMKSESKGDSAKLVKLKLVGDAAVPAMKPIRITGRSLGARQLTHPARAPAPGTNATIDTPWLTVLPKP